jgi:hypothetical protein
MGTMSGKYEYHEEILSHRKYIVLATILGHERPGGVKQLVTPQGVVLPYLLSVSLGIGSE